MLDGPIRIKDIRPLIGGRYKYGECRFHLNSADKQWKKNPTTNARYFNGNQSSLKNSYEY